MIATIRLQYRYLLSKISLWFLVIVAISLTVGILIASGFHSQMGQSDLNRQAMNIEYQNEALMILKFALIFVTVFLSIQGYYSQLCKYHLFFLQRANGKLHLGMSKIISIMMIQTLMGLHGGLAIHLIGLYLTPFFRIDFLYINAMILVILEMFILGLVGGIFVQIVDSIFSGMMPLFLFWVAEMNSDYLSIFNSKGLKIVYGIVANPLFFDGKWISVYTIDHYLIIFVFLSIINLMIFMLKDIKS